MSCLATERRIMLNLHFHRMKSHTFARKILLLPLILQQGNKFLLSNAQLGCISLLKMAMPFNLFSRIHDNLGLFFYSTLISDNRFQLLGLTVFSGIGSTCTGLSTLTL